MGTIYKWLHGVGGYMDVPPAQYQIYLFFTALMDQNTVIWVGQEIISSNILLRNLHDVLNRNNSELK